MGTGELLCEGSFPAFEHVYDITNVPKPISYASSHRRGARLDPGWPGSVVWNDQLERVVQCAVDDIGGTMSNKPLRTMIISAAVLSLSAAYAFAQTPFDPATASERNPNPATSTTTDEEGNNPLAREGDHSPTGHNPPLVTVGSGGPSIDPQAKPVENSVPDADRLPQRDPGAPPVEDGDGGGTGVPVPLPR